MAHGIDRREFLVGTGAALGGLLLPWSALRGDDRPALPEATRRALESSGFVYISPLRSSGEESRCHGEVWYFFDEGDVVIVTASDTWKARAVSKGRDRARIWVGDYGRVRLGARLLGDEAFRMGPSFEARVRAAGDRETFDRLLVSFGQKYPAEWDKWKPRFESGYTDGSRIVLRYTPA